LAWHPETSISTYPLVFDLASTEHLESVGYDFALEFAVHDSRDRVILSNLVI
jgi:hypothetical protein